jgi:purine nucleosidase
MTKKIILDLDTGVDDTLAIAYTLGSPEVELLGITGTYGNVFMPQGVRNSLAVLSLFGHPEIPVFPGIDHPSDKDEFLTPSVDFHGHNGVGEIDIPDSDRQPETCGAVDFIIDSVKRYGKELTLVPTGALTNVDAALKKAPEIKDEIGGIVMMGGALTACGNVNAWTEANISQDPEAADRVFRSGAPVTMIGLDVTLQTLLTRDDLARWRNLGTPAGNFLADMTDFYIDAYAKYHPTLNGCGLHDPLAAAVAIDPTFVKTRPMNMKVDVEEPTRGRTIGDNDRMNDATKTMEVALEVDVPRFFNEFLDRTCKAASL